MCKKKDKIRQSDAKISLMIMVKIKEWSSKLHVEQLPSKKPDKKIKKKFRPPVGFPTIISEMLQLANTPPILALEELYLAIAGQTNVEIKIVKQGETMMLAKLLIKKHKACWVYGNESQAHWWPARVLQTSTFLQIILKDGFGFQRNKLCALIASFLWYYKRLLLET